MGTYFMPMLKAPDAEKPALGVKFCSEAMPKIYEVLSKKIGDRKWLVGDDMSSVDINIASFFLNIALKTDNPMSALCVEGWNNAPANVKAWIENVRAEMKEYLDTRPKSVQ